MRRTGRQAPDQFRPVAAEPDPPRARTFLPHPSGLAARTGRPLGGTRCVVVPEALQVVRAPKVEVGGAPAVRETAAVVRRDGWTRAVPWRDGWTGAVVRRGRPGPGS